MFLLRGIFHPVATLFITCGLQGSGKTSLTMRLEENRSALQLTADEWLRDLYPERSEEELDAMRPPSSSCSGALPPGHWSSGPTYCSTGASGPVTNATSTGRQHAGRRCRAVPPRSAPSRVVDRLSRRNQDLPSGTFRIPGHELDRADTLFERPTTEELARFDPQWKAVAIEPLPPHRNYVDAQKAKGGAAATVR
jgi:hypothetical protein